MAIDENDLNGEIRADHEDPVEPDMQLKLGTELAEFGREFGGLDLEITRDPAATDAADFAEVGEMLDRRYDEIKSGRVEAIPGDEVEAHFRAKSAARRKQQEKESQA
jgi:hypothetical protein